MRGKDKEEMAKKLGAIQYIDSNNQDVAGELLKYGGGVGRGNNAGGKGANIILATLPSGSSIDSQDTLSFSILSGVRSVNEIFSLEQASEAYDRMISGKVRFRAVLQP